MITPSPSCFHGFPFAGRLWSAVLLLSLAFTASAVPASQPPGRSPAPAYRADRFLAKPKAGVGQGRTIAAAHGALGLEVRREFPRLGGWQSLRVPPGLSVEDAMTRLRQTGLFEYVEPDYRVHLLATPNDPKYTDGSLWGLNNTGQDGGTADADIDAPEAWDTRTDAVWESGGVTNEVIVGIIDTGMDYTHPDLVGNLWTNPCVNCPVNGIVYSNDQHGINAITGSGDPLDDHFHGTHVAGTVGAVGNNGIGVAGVAWRVKLMALKFLDSTGSGDVSDAVTCIDYAVAKGAHVLNNSWGGGPYSQALVDAIAAARNAGILFVVAAGNESNDNDAYPTYPASYTNDNVVAVMATDRNDKGSVFGETFFGTKASNYGYTSVKLGAPGGTIWSTFPTYTTAEMTSNSMPTTYYRLSGTSMATPHVSGAFALLRAQFPAETHLQLIQRLLGTTDPLEDLVDACLTQGRLNLAQALTNVPAPITRFRTYPLATTYYNTLHFTGGSPPLSVLCSNETVGATSFSWNFGDGSLLDTSVSPTHVYSNAGTFVVTLTATGTNGRTRSLSRQVMVDQNYKMDPAAPFAWVDPSSHSAVSLTDQSWASQPLPFPFLFYGRTNTTIYIGSNGQLGIRNQRIAKLERLSARSGRTQQHHLRDVPGPRPRRRRRRRLRACGHPRVGPQPCPGGDLEQHQAKVLQRPLHLPGAAPREQRRHQTAVPRHRPERRFADRPRRGVHGRTRGIRAAGSRRCIGRPPTRCCSITDKPFYSAATRSRSPPTWPRCWSATTMERWTRARRGWRRSR